MHPGSFMHLPTRVLDNSTGLRTMLYWGAAIVIAVVTPLSFVLNKLWTFRGGPRPSCRGASRSSVATRAAPHPGGFPVVGVIGAGQLARMMVGPAAEPGVTLSILAESATASAAPWSAPVRPGRCARRPGAVPGFARHCDVVTFDHEHVPVRSWRRSPRPGRSCTPARRPWSMPRTARHARAAHRPRASAACAARARTQRRSGHLRRAGRLVVVAKTPRAGMTARGVVLAQRPRTWPTGSPRWPGRLLRDGILLEERVDFRRELAAIVARSPSGQAAAWPVTQTVQTDGVCTQAIGPAPDLTPAWRPR